MRLVRAGQVILLVLALGSVLGRVFLVWNTDRAGGVTCIWLRLRPGLEWRQFSTVDPPAGEATSITCGNENGVVGEDWLAWNARFGWWGVPIGAALLAALLNRRRRSSESVH